jgi:ketosteroid isomerase-like protein
MAADEEAIATALMSYQDALSRSDANAVTKLFTTDGVLMAQESPSAVGTDAVRQAYGGHVWWHCFGHPLRDC